MSLINEALKKAQRLRTADTPTDIPPTPGGGGPIAKRAKPRSANTLVLIASGAIVLVVLSVIATVYLVNRPSKSPHPTAVVATSTKSETKAATTAAIVPPAITPPVVAPTIAPPVSEPVAKAPAQEAPVPVKPAPKKKSAPVAAPTATPKSVTPPPAAEIPPTRSEAPASPAVTSTPEQRPPPAAPAPAPVAPKADDRIVAFVESVRVAGIRSSGDDSRVLMNDRVYRVNDIVDRTLGIRLVKVAVDSLTFADAAGMTYVKYF